MSFAKRYAKTIAQFDFKPEEDLPYISPKDLYEEDGEGVIYTIKGVYLNRKSRFGESAVIMTEDFILNAPSHCTEDVQRMREDALAIEAINSGKAGFKIYTYENRYGVQYSVEWKDVE